MAFFDSSNFVALLSAVQYIPCNLVQVQYFAIILPKNIIILRRRKNSRQQSKNILLIRKQLGRIISAKISYHKSESLQFYFFLSVMESKEF